MPKMKTKSSAKKRFKVSATGKVIGSPGWQTARHDQAQQQVPAQRTRHDSIVRARRQDHQGLHALRPLREGARYVPYKRWVVTHARHKKVIKAAKGYYGRRKSTFKVARQAVDKANQYATRDRNNRKRNFRALWIQRINAAVRSHDEALTYSASSTV